jgi:hypothetical protein
MAATKLKHIWSWCCGTKLLLLLLLLLPLLLLLLLLPPPLLLLLLDPLEKPGRVLCCSSSTEYPVDTSIKVRALR